MRYFFVAPIHLPPPLHPDSLFSVEVIDRLCRNGAIFNNKDEWRWKESVADAYGEEEP